MNVKAFRTSLLLLLFCHSPLPHTYSPLQHTHTHTHTRNTHTHKLTPATHIHILTPTTHTHTHTHTYSHPHPPPTHTQSPLHLAVLTCQHKVIQYLLKANANPLVCDREGNTPLHLACRYVICHYIIIKCANQK